MRSLSGWGTLQTRRARVDLGGSCRWVGALCVATPPPAPGLQLEAPELLQSISSHQGACAAPLPAATLHLWHQRMGPGRKEAARPYLQDPMQPAWDSGWGGGRAEGTHAREAPEGGPFVEGDLERESGGTRTEDGWVCRAPGSRAGVTVPVPFGSSLLLQIVLAPAVSLGVCLGVLYCPQP